MRDRHRRRLGKLTGQATSIDPESDTCKLLLDRSLHGCVEKVASGVVKDHRELSIEKNLKKVGDA